MAAALIAACAAAAGAEERLTFAEAEALMLSANPQAASSAATLEAARKKADSARAALYPYLSAKGSYYREGTSAAPAYDYYSYGLYASQPLFAPASAAALRSARASLDYRQAAYDKTASGLRYSLTAAFADIVCARETVKLSEETLKRRAENVELIRIKYQAGRENKAALLETEATLEAARWQHQRYLKSLRLLERGLNRLLGRPAQSPVPELVPPAPQEPPADLSAFAAELDRHYSLRGARASLAEAAASRDSYRGAKLPSADLSANYVWSGYDWPSSPNSWAAGASVTLPLFSSGRLSADLDAAKKREAAAGADLRDAADQVSLDAEDAFLSWREARSWLDVAAASQQAAEARAWLVRKQYLAGQSSYFEWRNVEEQLINAKNQSLAAGRDLAKAGAAFRQSIGE